MKNRDWYTSLVSGLLFPLQERLKDHSTVSVRKELEVSQWWNRERLEDLQLLKLRHLLAEAEAHVPYYRGIFAEVGFKATEVSSLADLARLPLLDKPAIRANTEALKSEKARSLLFQY